MAKVIQDVCDPSWYGGTAAAMDELYGWASAYASVRPCPARDGSTSLSGAVSLHLDPLLPVNAAPAYTDCMLNGTDGVAVYALHTCVCTTPSPRLD